MKIAAICPKLKIAAKSEHWSSDHNLETLHFLENKKFMCSNFFAFRMEGQVVVNVTGKI